MSLQRGILLELGRGSSGAWQLTMEMGFSICPRLFPSLCGGGIFPFHYKSLTLPQKVRRCWPLIGSVGELLVLLCLLAHSSLASFVSSPRHYIVLGNSFREDFLQSVKASCFSNLNIQPQRVSPSAKGTVDL